MFLASFNRLLEGWESSVNDTEVLNDYNNNHNHGKEVPLDALWVLFWFIDTQLCDLVPHR